MGKTCAVTLFALLGGVVLPAAAQTYGDTLLAATARANPGITGLKIESVAKDGEPISLKWGRPTEEATIVPLANASGDTIGILSISSQDRKLTRKIAQRVSRRIYVADNLREADPFVPGAARSRLGQAIVDTMVDANPDLITLAMHVTLPGQKNAIIASNFGRIGKVADADDADVIAHGILRQEVTNGGKRSAVELPMLDREGRVIGALSTSFATADAARGKARALAVRDAIASRVSSITTLANK